MHSVCYDCKSDSVIVDYREGVAVCTSCGVVQETQIVDPDKEWRTFSDGTSTSEPRTGSVLNALIPEEYQLSTLNPKIVTQDDAEQRQYRSLMSSFNYIDLLCARMDVSARVANVAKEMFAKIRTKQQKLHAIESIATACVWEATMQCHIPRTAREISSISETSVSTLKRARKRLKKKISCETQSFEKQVSDYVDCYTASLQVGCWYVPVMICIRLALKHDSNLRKKTPMTLAASCVYAVQRWRTLQGQTPKFSLKSLARISDVSESAILTCIQELPEFSQTQYEEQKSRKRKRREFKDKLRTSQRPRANTI